VKTTIRPRPNVLPTAMPMIEGVLLSLSFEGGVEEDVGIGPFPTVDSGRPTACIAFTASNVSVETTSKYAHAGTEVSVLIFCGYLEMETIESMQFVRHEDHFVRGSAWLNVWFDWQAQHALRRE